MRRRCTPRTKKKGRVSGTPVGFFSSLRGGEYPRCRAFLDFYQPPRKFATRASSAPIMLDRREHSS
jgi:hypothetical protein